jgi:hypothetical protein
MALEGRTRGSQHDGLMPVIKSLAAVLVLEVRNVASRELGPSHLGNGCDLRIRMTDRSAEGAAVSGNPGKSSRCGAVEPEDAVR